MTAPIFLAWLVWLQAVHVVAGVALWRRRAPLSRQVKAALLSWGGLSQAYGIVQQHGGRITVESGAERGTTFTITRPAV
jgi:hypothetical protein